MLARTAIWRDRWPDRERMVEGRRHCPTPYGSTARVPGLLHRIRDQYHRTSIAAWITSSRPRVVALGVGLLPSASTTCDPSWTCVFAMARSFGRAADHPGLRADLRQAGNPRGTLEGRSGFHSAPQQSRPIPGYDGHRTVFDRTPPTVAHTSSPG